MLAPGAGRSGHYLVEGEGRLFVCHVKPAAGTQDHEIAALIAEHLAGEGVRTLVPLRTRDGRPHAVAGGYVATLVSHVPFRHADGSVADAYGLGLTLAQLHGSLRRFPGAPAVRKRTAEVAAQLAKTRALLRESIDDQLVRSGASAELLREAAARYDDTFGGDAPQCTHGDVTPGNVMFDESGHAWIADFEDAAFAFRPRLFDLASASLRFCPPGEAESPQVEALARGYAAGGESWPGNGAAWQAALNLVYHNLLVLAALAGRGGGSYAGEWRKFADLRELLA